MASNYLNLSNLKAPKPPAEPKLDTIAKTPKTTTTSGFAGMGSKSASPTVKKIATKAVPKAKAASTKAGSTPVSLVGGTAGALQANNLV